MTSKLQVTIPKVIADQYGIHPGDDIAWIAAGDAVRVVPSGRPQLDARHEQEAKTLADLTGWQLADIRKKMKIDDEATKANESDKSWYKNLWK